MCTDASKTIFRVRNATPYQIHGSTTLAILILKRTVRGVQSSTNYQDNFPASLVTYTWSMRLNWKSELVMRAPEWPLKTNMESLATAMGKLQQVGGQSPFCFTSSQTWVSP